MNDRSDYNSDDHDFFPCVLLSNISENDVILSCLKLPPGGSLTLWHSVCGKFDCVFGNYRFAIVRPWRLLNVTTITIRSAQALLPFKRRFNGWWDGWSIRNQRCCFFLLFSFLFLSSFVNLTMEERSLGTESCLHSHRIAEEAVVCWCSWGW